MYVISAKSNVFLTRENGISLEVLHGDVSRKIIVVG